MQEFEEDYYAILGVSEKATPEEMRKAYLGLAKKLHPDRYPNDPEKRAIAQSEFAKVTRAHDVVSDSESRAEYDAVRILAKKKAAAQTQDLDLNRERFGEGVKAVPLTSPSTESMKQPGDATLEQENINIKWANKHLGRAEDLYRRKRYQEAETAMKEAIRLAPNEPKYHNKLAEIYLARNWRTLAKTEVQAALRINPKDSEAKAMDAKIKAATRDKARGSKQAVQSKKGFFKRLTELFTKKL